MSEPRDLYYLWEQQQWQAGKIDLSQDEVPMDSRPALISGTATLLAVEDALTSALVALVDHIPGEEAQVFLTTELVDEARHCVFFDRVLSALMDDGGSMEARVASARAGLAPGWISRLGELQAASAAVRSRRQGAITASIRLQIDVKEAARALLEEMAASAGPAPGLRAGLDLVGRDEERHLQFARSFLAHGPRVA